MHWLFEWGYTSALCKQTCKLNFCNFVRLIDSTSEPRDIYQSFVFICANVSFWATQKEQIAVLLLFNYQTFRSLNSVDFSMLQLCELTEFSNYFSQLFATSSSYWTAPSIWPVPTWLFIFFHLFRFRILATITCDVQMRSWTTVQIYPSCKGLFLCSPLPRG